MATEDSTIVQSDCPSCQQETAHDIKGNHKESGDDEYNCSSEYRIVKCRGCGHVTFRYVFSDFENAFPTSDDEWDVPRDIEIYPKFLKNHRELDGFYNIPEVVQDVYNETLSGIREGAGILAGLGLRGTIEAVCNDQRITGKNLEIRIARLATQGLISQRDAERLHAIRFLGNDAAHEILKPTKAQISVALKIVDHLIASVYILEAEAAGTLDTIVSTYEKFFELLEPRLNNFQSGDEYPLAKFLGKDVRRIQGSISTLEPELISRINTGSVTCLQVGKLAPFATSPTPLQHFIVV